MSECPLAECLVSQDAANHRVTQHSAMTRLKSQNVDLFRAVWPELLSAAGHGADQPTAMLDDALRHQAAMAIAQVVSWRQRLCDSLRIWDTLLCAADPLARHEAPLRRLCRLLDALWPRLSAPTSCGAGGGAPEMQADDGQVQRLLEPLLGALLVEPGSALPSVDLRKLTKDLLAAAGGLDAALRKDLEALSAAEQEDLPADLASWFERLRLQCWQPLAGATRNFFIACVPCPGEVTARVYRRLCGTGGSVVTALLNPLVSGNPAPGAQQPEDLTLVWRFLQCAKGRRVDVSELWKAFNDRAPLGPGEGRTAAAKMAQRRRRFGHAVASLNLMGLHLPRGGPGAAFSGKSGGWRLVRRHFGRIWRATKNPADAVAAREAGGAKERIASVLEAEDDGAEAEADAARRQAESDAVRAKRLAPPKTAPTPRMLGRHASRFAASRKAWTQDSARARYGKKGKKARIFMG